MLKFGLYFLVGAMIIGVVSGYMMGPDFYSSELHEIGPQMVGLLSVLLLVSAGLVAQRPSGGEVLKSILLWGGLGLLLVALYSFRHEFSMIKDRVMAELMPGNTVTTAAGEIAIARSGNGQFVLNALVDGTSIQFLVDTGASHITLTSDDARRAQFPMDRLRYTVPVQTANGTGFVAPIRIDHLQIGDVTLNDARAFVAQQGMLNSSLMGMSTLDRFSGIRVEGDRMILTPRGS
ncbi:MULTISPECIES: TIGR02281 family clan AA aspartic protease [Pseudovibrio]|uniref:retropepsin-like aspartic protease family protein n=1 Tax=Stappiaceae TaxID=2821832 RepID=UPI0023652F96|nr:MULTISPECIES: TIGR02281 family clan AA aspartic protease [Pseudovibrio]MDD7909068.1 TIGR02281 family clan AA aspartic protease [Pseudovibrio exalbescens]MDX5593611.1 TIGR02281 family clan AA aspartic protease [Pseudovibrio sp. SPO723]